MLVMTLPNFNNSSFFSAIGWIQGKNIEKKNNKKII